MRTPIDPDRSIWCWSAGRDLLDKLYDNAEEDSIIRKAQKSVSPRRPTIELYAARTGRENKFSPDHVRAAELYRSKEESEV